MELTEKEKQYMGALVQTNKELIYPHFTLPAGSGGNIYDYGRNTGDPFVNFGGTQCIVGWKDIIVIKFAAKSSHPSIPSSQ
jgi:hypothetical protein